MNVYALSVLSLPRLEQQICGSAAHALGLVENQWLSAFRKDSVCSLWCFIYVEFERIFMNFVAFPTNFLLPT